MPDGRVIQNNPVESSKKLSAPLGKGRAPCVIFGIIRVSRFLTPSCPLLSILPFNQFDFPPLSSLSSAIIQKDHLGGVITLRSWSWLQKRARGRSASRWCVRYGFMFFLRGKVQKTYSNILWAEFIPFPLPYLGQLVVPGQLRNQFISIMPSFVRQLILPQFSCMSMRVHPRT